MDFNLSTEQKLIVETVRAFVERELYPHELEVERSDRVTSELAADIKRKAIEAGLFAANMPEALGGVGLDAVSMALMERELGRASMALHTAHRPGRAAGMSCHDRARRRLRSAFHVDPRATQR